MGKNIGKDISKSLNSKYSQKLLYHAYQSATDAFKTSSKRVIQKKAEIADKITRGSKTSPDNNLGTIKEILKEKCISPELKQR